MISLEEARQIAYTKNEEYKSEEKANIIETIDKRIRENVQWGYYECKIYLETPERLTNYEYEKIIKEVLKEVANLGYKVKLDTGVRYCLGARYCLTIDWEED